LRSWWGCRVGSTVSGMVSRKLRGDALAPPSGRWVAAVSVPRRGEECLHARRLGRARGEVERLPQRLGTIQERTSRRAQERRRSRDGRLRGGGGGAGGGRGGGRTRERPAGERTVDEPHVALRYPEGVADVAGAVPVDVARLGLRELTTLPQPHIELGHYERIPDIDDPVPVHVAAADCGDRGGRRRRGCSTRGGGREQEGKGKAGSQKPTGREAQGVLLYPPPQWRTGVIVPRDPAIRQSRTSLARWEKTLAGILVPGTPSVTHIAFSRGCTP